jgi:hypothetical protein
MIKRTENSLPGLTCRVLLVLLLYLHCTQYQQFLQEFLSVTVLSTSESHHSAFGPSSLVVVLCQMGCYVPVQQDYLFSCSLFNHVVSRLVKDNNSVNKTGIYKACCFFDVLHQTYRQSHLCKSSGTHKGHRTREADTIYHI